MRDEKIEHSVDRFALLSDAAKVKIASMLPLYAIGRLAQCCPTFRDACTRRSIWIKTLPKAFHLLAREHAQSVDERSILRRWIECSSLDVRVVQVTRNGSVPDARFLHRSVRLGKKMLVFGGKSAVDYFDECWLLDLVTLQWERLRTDIDSPTPEPRCSPSLTCLNGPNGMNGTNGMNESVLLFGGRSRSEQFLCDMWLLEVTEGTCRWTQCVDYTTDLIPTGRWAHSAVSMHGRLLVFGGSNRRGALSDLWCFDPFRRAWVELTPENNMRTDTHDTDASDTDASDTDAPVVGPCARGGHSMACISEDAVVMFGGNDMRNTFRDVWVLQLCDYVSRPRWTRLDGASDTAPPARVGHTMLAIDDGRIVIFGGRNFLQASFDERVYILDVKTERWHVRSARDEDSATDASAGLRMTRTGHSAIEYNGSIIVFGGLHNVDSHQNVFLNDLLRLSLVGSDIDTHYHGDESPVVRLKRVHAPTM